MARRSVVMDGDLRYFEVSVPAVGLLVSRGHCRHVRSHYDGDFADCNIYSPLRKTLEEVRTFCGGDALTEIQQADLTYKALVYKAVVE